VLHSARAAVQVDLACLTSDFEALHNTKAITSPTLTS
jgi:hypothetical protein